MNPIHESRKGPIQDELRSVNNTYSRGRIGKIPDALSDSPGGGAEQPALFGHLPRGPVQRIQTGGRGAVPDPRAGLDGQEARRRPRGYLSILEIDLS